MEGIVETVFELGRFGDRRLEKGGRCCTGHWLKRQARASADWRGGGAVRFNFIDFCAMSG